MVHHTEWDRKIDQKGGYMQKDHNEMEEIIKEMAAGNHYYAFKDESVKSDSQILHDGASTTVVVHRGADYDHSLPSLYNGKWCSHFFMMSVLKVFLFIILTFIALKFLMKPLDKRSGSKSRCRSR